MANHGYNKELYRKLCVREKSIPIFSRDWWLDALCGEDNWDVCLGVKSDEIMASMPYYKKQKYGLKVISQPKLTQTLGPWLRPSSAKYAKQLAQHKKLLNELIDQLPSFDYFSQNWHHSNTNWLPFYWRGFQQTTRYTYIIQNLSDQNRLWSGLMAKIRTDIRKAEGRFGLEVRDDLGLDAFLELNRKTFARQGQKIPYTDELAGRLDEACGQRNCRKFFIAVDSEGRRHAGAYIVWDENSAYYLMGGGDPELRNSGATSLCMWYAIKHAATVTRCFDFEGSMIEPVERFFRAFGAVQVPYFNITKTNSRLLRLRQCARNIMSK